MEQTEISLATFNTYGTDLEKMLVLKTYPIAIKLLKSESEIPRGAVRPKKEKGEHYAMCQVFGVARRQGTTLAMFLEDHWCFEPIISYGLVATPQDYLERIHEFLFHRKQRSGRQACPRDDAPAGREVRRDGSGAAEDGEFRPGSHDDLFQHGAVEASALQPEIPQWDAGDLDHRSDRFLRALGRALRF